MKAVILWHRSNLRIEENATLQAALSTRAPLFPVFIYSPESEAPWAPGAASRWWLHHSLEKLEKSYLSHASKLHFARAKNAAKTVLSLAKEMGAEEIFLDRRFEPAILASDRELASLAKKQGVTIHAFNDHLLLDIQTVRTKTGGVYQVYTPFKNTVWDAVLKAAENDEVSLPLRFPKFQGNVSKLCALKELHLLPDRPWAKNWNQEWKVGESFAKENLEDFFKKSVKDYSINRDIPSVRGTSRLSPHLHFGELSPKAVVREILKISKKDPRFEGAQKYLSEIVWREFAHYLMLHFPHTCEKPLRREFENFPWQKIDPAKWQAFVKGETGFPIVDAGMRELWATGWMHNRVRMIVASFLVKDLRYHWLDGAKWFWDTLVDADLASNTFGWQWSAGSGADAAPYYRIFNPELQATRYDEKSLYLRRWLTAKDLARTPILNHREARDAALLALKSLKKTSRE